MNTHLSAQALASLLLALAIPSAQAEIYRWTDASGRVHFSNQKPMEAQGAPVETYHSGMRVSIMEGTSQPSALPHARIRMFTTQWCPICKKAKAYLRERGIPFEELDVEASASAKAEYDQLGGKGVPVILVGERRMDGFDAGRMESALAEAGQ